MAAEAQAESPGPVPPPPPACGGSSPASSPPEKRALTDMVPAVDGEEEGEEEQRLPEPKRRRASVAALDSVPSAEAEGAAGGPPSGAAAPFSFQHARGGFLAPETTPKFGSFNPPGEDAAEPAALDLKPAQRGTGAGGEGSLEADDEVPSTSAGGAEDNDEHVAQVVGGKVDGQVQTDQT
ncbi:hypothetical protein HU200_012208 [Digitaria exilis]|uniref:Uncharacterized protein n=1 Tax=Digitaria exilis TaxID=1010633 RepID=A0A835FFG7_9POAL|nr:hypothetical protein HU200_012208 [Digitaria exilis]